jgi:hypothetical protein
MEFKSLTHQPEYIIMKNLKTYLLATAIAAGMQSASAQTKTGYTNLFNGKDLSGWKILAGKAEYKVENGGITGTAVLNSGNTFLVTEKEYGDFILELDAKTEST